MPDSIPATSVDPTPPVIALVTAWNEESTIAAVLRALQSAESIDQIQVVDDGSTDSTREVALSCGVKVISLPERVPVGQAIMHHLTDLPDDAILVWCDADLLGLRGEHIDQLVQRYHAEGLTMSMSSRSLPRSWPGRMKNALTRRGWAALFGPLSGERVILKHTFDEAITLSRKLGWSEMMRGYGIVLFLNWYADRFGNGYAVTYFDDLQQRQKYEKWGRHCLWEMAHEWMQFIRTWMRIRLNAGRICRVREVDAD